jgi:L-2-hydroxyglutarate oxidase LhgO
LEQAHRNSVSRAELIGTEKLREMEPHLSTSALGAVWIPDECITDPHFVPIFYLYQALEFGAKVSSTLEAINLD